MNYDVIVSGAGPAGSTTASAVSQAGYNVLLLEKNNSCISPCAGFVSSTINTELPRSAVIQSKIKRMRTYFPDLSFHDFALNGFVVDRQSFDAALAVKAKESGTEIKFGSQLIEFIKHTNTVEVVFRGGRAYGKIIVGSDGVFSRTASLLGEKKQKIMVCAQYHLKGIKPLFQTCEIFFNTDYAPGGYVWIYPTGEDSAKVGLGTSSKYPRRCLDAFIRGSSLAERLGGMKTEYITGALPVGGLRERLCFGNILLAGDSAGMADPVTGAGINNAMLAGEMAGRTIINALENDDMDILAGYEARIKRLLGRPLARALEKRKKLDACCASNEILQRHLPELWVAFKQYWV